MPAKKRHGLELQEAGLIPDCHKAMSARGCGVCIHGCMPSPDFCEGIELQGAGPRPAPAWLGQGRSVRLPFPDFRPATQLLRCCGARKRHGLELQDVGHRPVVRKARNAREGLRIAGRGPYAITGKAISEKERPPSIS